MHGLKGCIHLKTPYGAATEKVIELGLLCVSLGIKHLQSCLPTAEEKIIFHADIFESGRFFSCTDRQTSNVLCSSS